MAEVSISTPAPAVNDNPIHIDFLNGSTPAVRSDILSEHFNRRHKNVLRDIAKLRAKCPESFYGLNFRPVDYTDSKGEKRPAYLLTRDAFSLLVMGFTGAAAIRWKLKYIEAFNALEAAVLHDRAELAREAGYQQGRDEASALPAVQAASKAAYLEGMREGQRVQKRQDGLVRLRKLRRYVAAGLSRREMAAMLGMSFTAVRSAVERLRKEGLLA